MLNQHFQHLIMNGLYEISLIEDYEPTRSFRNIENKIFFSNITFDDENMEEIFPFVVIDSLDELRFKSIVIERVFDFESFVVCGDVGETIIVVDVGCGGGGGGVVECCVRNFGAIRRRLTDPSRELSE